MKKHTICWLLSVSSPAFAAQVEPFAYVDSVVYSDSLDGKGASAFSEALGVYNVHHDEANGGHNHAGLKQGAQVRSIEAGATWQPSERLDSKLKGAFSPEAGEGEIEEAWLRYRPHPTVSIKGGKFLSAFGAHNTHPHEWNFVQQNLPTQMLLDGGLNENGVQVEWQPPLKNSGLRLGLELLEGGNRGVAAQQESVAGYKSTKGKLADINYPAHPDFPQVSHVYVKADKTLNPNNTLTGGVSYLQSRQHQELHRYHPGINDADHGLSGTASLWAVDAGLQHHSGHTSGIGDASIQAEYLYQNKDLTLQFHEDKPNLVGQPRDLHVDGYSLEGTYRFAPKWQLGLRHERVGGTHEARRPSKPPFPTHTSYFDDVRRNSVAVTWQPAKQHRLRLEAARSKVPLGEDTNADGRDEAVVKRYNQFMLQYQWSLDADHDHASMSH